MWECETCTASWRQGENNNEILVFVEAGNVCHNCHLFEEGPVSWSWFVSGLVIDVSWYLFLLFSNLYTVALYVGPIISDN